MSTSPTISLCMIVKNESKNISRLLNSVEGCFDQIVIVDTGSTDNTKELALARGCEVHDFVWVNSFCKARNFAFSKATCDFIMWMDGDDVLHNNDGFITWKKHAMEFADCWFATYHYALDKDGKPIISFVRERVFKRSVNPVWQFDLHEGVVCEAKWSRDYAIPWAINHLRDAEDIASDKSRNISILEEMRTKGTLDPRLKFYYAKELYEIGRCTEGLVAFEEALKEKQEHHDRLLSFQYAASCAFQLAVQTKDEFVQEKVSFWNKSIDFALEGLKLDPNRAEFHNMAADAYLAKREIMKSIPHYAAAKHCISSKDMGSPYEGAIYSFTDHYGILPSLQLAKCYFHLGKLKESKKEAREAWIKFKHPEAKAILDEVTKIQRMTRMENNQEQTEDIVFTCPPVTAYPFDEDMYETNPLGGSETALVQVAKQLKALTGRRVIVFNMREADLMAKSGVEYLSNKSTYEYFSKKRPRVHIAWRHNMKLTKAPTYLWCHDLVTPSVEAQRNFDKILCLSEFHKNYVMAKQAVPDSEIIVTDNGLDPAKFNFTRKPKNKNKLVWMSSPDRGLDRAMLVCDKVREEFPEIELHVYYGLDNLYKYGLADLANKLKDMMAHRDYVHYHGFTEQSKMYKEVSDAVVWVHPCNFIETNCITAKEMLALQIFPVTRSLGALANTLAEAEELDQAILLPHDCVTATEVQSYANAVKLVLREKRWEHINFDINRFSWNSLAKSWVKFMDMKEIGVTA